ncbi:MAG: ATP cone domain-containing protein [Planctomycetota bacterium JB042]
MIRSSMNVRKRDGREVPFDQAKIADAIDRAARSVGGQDRFLAEELASVVAMFIEKEWSDRTPSIDDVSDLIEKVLVETGHAAAAKAFILERDRRARIRSALRVRDDERPAPNEKLPTVDARAHAKVSSWSKGKIVEALLVEGDLPPSVAEEIAAAVERRVFSSGMTRVSTSLVRALVDNELFERGYDRVLNRQATIGLPRYDLDRLIRAGVGGGLAAGGADANDRAVAAASWTQYSLLAVHSPEVVEAHLAGRIHVGSLGSPTRVQRLEVDVPPAPADASAGAALDAARLYALRAGETVDEELVLRGLDRLPALLSFDDPAEAAERLLSALGHPAELPPPSPRLALEVRPRAAAELADAAKAIGLSADETAARQRAFAAALFAAAARLGDRDGVVAPRLLLGLRPGERSSDDLDLLEACVLAEGAPGRAGIVVEAGAFAGGLASFVPTWLRVDVDVAQSAFRVRRFETGAVVKQVGEAIGLAAAACEARARFFDGLPEATSPRGRLARLGGSRERVGGRYEIGLAGLDAACRVAFDHPPSRDERSLEFARAVVEAARKRVADEAKRRRLPLVAAFTDDADVLQRFGTIDFDRFPRGRDVHGVPHDGRRYLYSSSLSSRDDGPPPEATAALEATLREGMLPTPLPNDHADAADRIRFVRAYVDPSGRSPQECV